MKLTKKQFTNLIKEITDETLKEGFAKNCPSRPMEETQSSAVSSDIKQFAKEILQKINDRVRRVGNARPDLHMPEAVRQMIEHKLNKEGWVKGGINISAKPTDGERAKVTHLGAKSDAYLWNENSKIARIKKDFEDWIAKAQYGVQKNNLAYDLAEEAFEAGYKKGYESSALSFR